MPVCCPSRACISCRLLRALPQQAFLTSTHLCIAMELVTGGTLFNYVLGPGAAGRPPLGVEHARWLFQMLIIGLDFMHRSVMWVGVLCPGWWRGECRVS